MLGWQVRRIATVLLGTVLIGSGVLMGAGMSRAIDERVRSGERVLGRACFSRCRPWARASAWS